MSDLFDDIWSGVTGVIGAVAPTIATAFGGPLAGTAVSAVLKATGITDPSTAADAIKSGDPEVLLKLKTAELEFQKTLKGLDVDLERIAASDRASARDREVKTGDKTPAVLAYGVTIGFFGVLLFILFKGVPTVGGDALLVMLGALGAAWTGIVTYYFGSSAGSKTKTDALATIAAK